MSNHQTSNNSLVRRRGQKQRQQTTPTTKQKSLVLNSKQYKEAISTIQKLDRTKRRISHFNKILLIIAIICVGNNVYTILLNRQHHHKINENNNAAEASSNNGGSTAGGVISSVLGEAFQSLQQSNNFFPNKGKGSSLFGSSSSSSANTNNGMVVPKNTLQDFGSYPNIFNITEDMRNDFHPIIKIPLRKKEKGIKKNDGVNQAIGEDGTSCAEEIESKQNGHNNRFWSWIGQRRNGSNSSSCTTTPNNNKMNEMYDYIIKDYTGQKSKNNDGNDNKVVLQGGKKVPQLLSSKEEAIEYAKYQKQSREYDVGRYDEDRRGMYTSSLFSMTKGKPSRTLHVGLDIGGPIDTKVYAFTHGTIHSVGYNPPLGDYGNVMVIEHTLPNDTIVYALYGHLSAKSIRGKYVGQKIKKGQVIGYLGNTAENGGWTGMICV